VLGDSLYIYIPIRSTQAKSRQWFIFYIVAVVEQSTIACFIFIDATEQRHIRNVLAHWTEHTCVRFSELGIRERYSGHYFKFIKSTNWYVIRY